MKPPLRPEDSITSMVSSVTLRHPSSSSEQDQDSNAATGSRLIQRNKRRSSVLDLKTETERQVKANTLFIT